MEREWDLRWEGFVEKIASESEAKQGIGIMDGEIVVVTGEMSLQAY